jgi:predicted porin
MIRPLSAALLAASGIAVAPAYAQSSVSLYGLMDMSVGRFQTAGTDKVWRADSGNMTTSYLGFKGTEDLGGGMKAKFQIEHFLRLDAGAAGRFNGDAFWARNAIVGLEGNFGSTTLGRNTTPLFVSTLIFNPIGDSFGFSPSIRHWFLGAILGDTGWNNSIRYASPSFGGASFNLMANLTEGSGVSKNLGANVLYFGGPFAATLAWQDVGNGVPVPPAGFDGQSAWQLGASYDLKMVKLFGQYGRTKTKATATTETTLYQAGVSVPIGLGSVLASYGNAKAETGAVESTRKTTTIGYDYFLSKQTDVYAIFMNDKATGPKSGNTLAAGVRHRF